ncbi:MAG: cupredoxin domain-containing protein [Bacteriovoracia bacterium]
MERELRNRFIFVLVVGLLFSRPILNAKEIEEVYDAYSTEGYLLSDEVDVGRDEIRLSRPEEAAERIALDQASNLVPGVTEALRVPLKRADLVETKDAEKKLPEDKKGRALASEKTSKGASLKQPLPKRTGPQEVSLIVGDDGYYPKELVVAVSQPVKIYLTSSSKSTLCFILDRWGIKKGIEPQKVENVTFVPDQAGKFRFYCPVGSLEGSLLVKPKALDLSDYHSTASLETNGEHVAAVKTEQTAPSMRQSAPLESAPMTPDNAGSESSEPNPELKAVIEE